MRTDRRDRRLREKSDTLDAENSAREVLAGHAIAVPKTADGMCEMIRQVKVAKDIAVKARTAAMIFALLLGGHLQGIPGALLALPLAAIARETLLYLRRHSIMKP